MGQIYMQKKYYVCCFHQKFIKQTKGEGGVMNVHVDKGRGLEKCPRLSMRGGEGVKNRQNLVHVVIE